MHPIVHDPLTTTSTKEPFLQGICYRISKKNLELIPWWYISAAYSKILLILIELNL